MASGYEVNGIDLDDLCEPVRANVSSAASLVSSALGTSHAYYNDKNSIQLINKFAGYEGYPWQSRAKVRNYNASNNTTTISLADYIAKKGKVPRISSGHIFTKEVAGPAYNETQYYYILRKEGTKVRLWRSTNSVKGFSAIESPIAVGDLNYAPTSFLVLLVGGGAGGQGAPTGYDNAGYGGGGGACVYCWINIYEATGSTAGEEEWVLRPGKQGKRGEDNDSGGDVTPLWGGNTGAYRGGVESNSIVAGGGKPTMRGGVYSFTDASNFIAGVKGGDGADDTPKANAGTGVSFSKTIGGEHISWSSSGGPAGGTSNASGSGGGGSRGNGGGGGGPTSAPGSDGSYPGGGGGGGTASYRWPEKSDDREGGYGAKGAFYIYY